MLKKEIFGKEKWFTPDKIGLILQTPPPTTALSSVPRWPLFKGSTVLELKRSSSSSSCNWQMDFD